MYNLLVAYDGWNATGTDSMSKQRTFEYTDDRILKAIQHGSSINPLALTSIPTLFMSEIERSDAVANVGKLTSIQDGGSTYNLRYSYQLGLPAIPVDVIWDVRNELSIGDWEFNRTHWAVKDVDLFQVLIGILPARRHQPKVFALTSAEQIEANTVSLMMPFREEFDRVYLAIEHLASEIGFACRRVDDMSRSSMIMQDIVSLLDRSSVVIVDCTNCNPNVFYELGIAHTLGREVILITQTPSAMPFDIRHLRHLQYLNNDEGLRNLCATLKEWFEDIAL